MWTYRRKKKQCNRRKHKREKSYAIEENIKERKVIQQKKHKEKRKRTSRACG